MSEEKYRVRVTKDYLVFSAAHFITFNGNVCERLHGHNYRVAAEIHGPLDQNYYVIDFIWLRDTLRDIVETLDHRMLLPTEHTAIRVCEEDGEVVVTFEDRRWVFPRGDCVLLPVSNTTAEQLAKYIGDKVLQKLPEVANQGLTRLIVSVDENEGQQGICDLSYDRSS